MKEEVMDIIDFIEVKEEILDYKQDAVFENIPTPTEENVESPCTSLKVSCINNPIVYTTRLEEMHIFQKDLNKLPSHSIINDVISESKPKVRQCIKNIKHNESSVSKFLRLLCILQQYNYMISKTCSNSSKLKDNTKLIEIKSQNKSKCRKINKMQALMDLCKPLFVKLIDCKKLLSSSLSAEIGKCRNLQNSCALIINKKVSNGISSVEDDNKKKTKTHFSSLYEAFTNVLLLKNAEYKRSLELFSVIRSAAHPSVLLTHKKPSNQNDMPSFTDKNEAINNTKQLKQTITTKIKPKRNALNDVSSNKKARRNTTSSEAKHVAVQTSDTMPEQRTKPPNNTKKRSKTNLKTVKKRRFQEKKINALSNNLSEEPAGLNTSFVSSQVSNVTAQTSCVLPQGHAIPMQPSNTPIGSIFSPAVNQQPYQYLNAMAQVISLSGPVTTSILPNLLLTDNSNTNLVVSSVPQSGSLLPVQENVSSIIPQASNSASLSELLSKKNVDDGCILGI